MLYGREVAVGFLLLSLLSASILLSIQVEAFADPRPAPQRFKRPSTALLSSSNNYYGKGADIWPPTNEKDPVKLSDSFPNGAIPTQVKSIFQQTTSDAERNSSNGPLRWRKLLPRPVDRIISRATFAKEEGDIYLRQTSRVALAPFAFAIGLAAFVKPIDGLLVTMVSGYLCILSAWCRTKRNDGVTPSLPALPPQGHVPAMVSNPLGYEMTYSIPYDRWLKLGVGLGLLGPLVTVIHATFIQTNREVAVVCARPAFWLCCQTLSEKISRRTLTPLPLRILIPMMYNGIRLAYIWQWACYGGLGRAVRALAVLNLLYWSLNLFAFLLPVAAMRYMRAHFFCVEAEQVTTRPGMEGSMGLSSYEAE